VQEQDAPGLVAYVLECMLWCEQQGQGQQGQQQQQQEQQQQGEAQQDSRARRVPAAVSHLLLEGVAGCVQAGATQPANTLAAVKLMLSFCGRPETAKLASKVCAVVCCVRRVCGSLAQAAGAVLLLTAVRAWCCCLFTCRWLLSLA
jgi:hypothetical protein